MADVVAEKVEWLWPGRIPRGKVTLLEGDPKCGKSTLALDLAARVSTGTAMPDGSPLVEPEQVILMTAEDGLADTVRPRLDAARAETTASSSGNRLRLSPRTTKSAHPDHHRYQGTLTDSRAHPAPSCRASRSRRPECIPGIRRQWVCRPGRASGPDASRQDG